VNMVKDMFSSGKEKIEATMDVEQLWTNDVWKLANASLFPKAKSVSLKISAMRKVELT
jgi:hypothetical protein